MTLQSALPSPPSSAKNFFGKVVFKVGSVGKDIFVDIAVGVISTADTTDNAVNSVKFVNVAAYTITSVNRKFVTANFVDIEANTIYIFANSFGDYCSVTDSSFRDTAIPVNSVESSFHKYNKVEKSVFVETSAAEHLVGASDLVESAINSISFVGASFSDYCPLECHLYTGCSVLISASASNALNNRQNKYQTFFRNLHRMSRCIRRRYLSRRRFLHRSRCKPKLHCRKKQKYSRSHNSRGILRR